MTERELQDAIVEAAGYKGWLVYHTYDSRRSQKGWPDLAMVKAPRLLLVELKDDDGELTEEQQQWAVELNIVEQAVSVLQPFADVPLVAHRVWRPGDWTIGEVDRELSAKVGE